MSTRSVDEVSGQIVDVAFRLHTKLGPGLLESVYESILARGLESRGLLVERQKSVPFDFEGQHFADGLRLDLLIQGQVIVEVKSIEKLAPVHSKQLLTYLRLMNLRVGLLLNFGGATLKEGIRRLVNGYIPQTLASSKAPYLRAKPPEAPHHPKLEI